MADAIKRSTMNGVEQNYLVYREDDSEYEVPSYAIQPGFSAQSAAESLGGRLLGRREDPANFSVLAEIHDDRSWLVVSAS